ncbi:NAD(P)H-quinone oxidoreductase subunit N, chloroplastic isoform X2 [Amborella trichopoda]|uniref:NAD(P)H-quinone oxidoreductase subunit N, chloroplastic isoform X2 n=1 Tax=Amborella trichopoda TaxID=13333 RepID=UPI0005D3E821|nr:NAD(P)H-quinone oxidoreductase subunit N, chloroplastic isoform X2 [Amborella trichopoda]|eukprot:XP_011622705.1 NAD(P)H-quinone oxidoreductase subunit N, chloroplastic isoform X2 [Amborella trichopoda]
MAIPIFRYTPTPAPFSGTTSGFRQPHASKSIKFLSQTKLRSRIKCGLQDFIGGDLVKPDLGKWLSDVEEHKALAIYPPHEGGYEGRYFTRLRYQGYYFLDLSARGLGDPETTLTKIHPVCPAHLGRQPIARWYFPPEVDYRLSLLPPNAKGLVVWIMEAKVLSKAELQFLALLPSLRPKVKVIAECGNWGMIIQEIPHIWFCNL